MKRSKAILLCTAVCLVVSLPFAVIVIKNIRPEPYGGLRRDSLFQAASVCFFIQHILALIGQFLMFVNHMDEDRKSCAPVMLGGLGAVCSCLLTWKGETVRMIGDFSSYDRFSNANVSGAMFWICISVIWAGILFSTVMLILGKISDN